MNIPAHQFARYIMVGGTAYLFEMGVLIALHDGLHIRAVASAALSFWAGFIAAFLMQKFITFRNHSRHKKALTKQLVAYSGLVAFNYGFTLAAVALLHDNLPVVVVRTGVIITTTLWNFVLYKRLFSARNNDVPAQ